MENPSTALPFLNDGPYFEISSPSIRCQGPAEAFGLSPLQGGAYIDLDFRKLEQNRSPAKMEMNSDLETREFWVLKAAMKIKSSLPGFRKPGRIANHSHMSPCSAPNGSDSALQKKKKVLPLKSVVKVQALTYFLCSKKRQTFGTETQAENGQSLKKGHRDSIISNKKSQKFRARKERTGANKTHSGWSFCISSAIKTWLRKKKATNTSCKSLERREAHGTDNPKGFSKDCEVYLPQLSGPDASQQLLDVCDLITLSSCRDCRLGIL